MCIRDRDKTPLYAEMGGQVADHGLFTDGDMVFEVTNVQKDKAGKYLHYGIVKSGTISVDQTVKAEIDTERRAAVASCLLYTSFYHKHNKTQGSGEKS